VARAGSGSTGVPAGGGSEGRQSFAPKKKDA
jgi:hypothetical protein